MSDWETVNISRIINGKNMKFSEDLTNRNLLQVTKFSVVVEILLIMKITCFYGYADDNAHFLVRDNAEVVLEALKKLMKLPLNGFQTIR